MSTAETTAAILEALQQRHQLPEWALLTELRLSTGYAGSEQRMDAVAFNCWPSKGHVRIGFEVKASRADLLRDLRSSKWQGYLPFVHQFYFVLPRETKFIWSEVPDQAGVIRWNGEQVQMTETHPAPLLTPDIGDIQRSDQGFYLSAVRRALQMPAQENGY